MMLLFLIMRCMPTRELIEATPLPLSSQPATSLSALAPAQRAGAQRLCALKTSGLSWRSATSGSGPNSDIDGLMFLPPLSRPMIC